MKDKKPEPEREPKPGDPSYLLWRTKQQMREQDSVNGAPKAVPRH